VERFELLQGQSANNTSMIATQIKDIKMYFRANGVERKDSPDAELKQLKRELEQRTSDLVQNQVRRAMQEREVDKNTIENRLEAKLKSQFSALRKSLTDDL
jgi:hypothetical protein